MAATILPAQSEGFLAALILADTQPLWLLIAIASLGNVLGAIVNWILGRAIARFRDRPWFPASPAQLDRAEAWFSRYGKWSLLLSWLPFVGDPLTVVAGALRVPLLTFAIIVTIAKTGRYLVIAALFG